MKYQFNVLVLMSCLFVGFAYLNCGVNKDSSLGQLKFGELVLTESTSNEGIVEGVVNISLLKDSFKADLQRDKDYLIANVPDGLQVDLSRVDDQNLSLNVSGTSENHVRCDYDAIGFSLNESAMTSQTLPANHTVEILVDYRPGTYDTIGSSVFTEVSDVDEAGNSIDGTTGAVEGQFTIAMLDGARVQRGELAEGIHYSLDKELPKGLVLNVFGTSDTALEVLFSGNAESNYQSDSVSVGVALNMVNDFEEDPNQIAALDFGDFCTGQKYLSFPLKILFKGSPPEAEEVPETP